MDNESVESNLNKVNPITFIYVSDDAFDFFKNNRPLNGCGLELGSQYYSTNFNSENLSLSTL